jgi:hypothetical protein
MSTPPIVYIQQQVEYTRLYQTLRYWLIKGPKGKLWITKDGYYTYRTYGISNSNIFLAFVGDCCLTS